MSTVEPATSNLNSHFLKRTNRSTIHSNTTCTEETVKASKGPDETPLSRNLYQPHPGTSEMGFELLRRHYQEMSVDLKKEGQSQELMHKNAVERLLLELKNGKETNAAMKKQIEAYQGVLKAKRLALEALSSRLEEIKSENKRVTTSLSSCRDGQQTCFDVGQCSSETEDDLSEHNQVVDHFLKRLESTVQRLQECNHDNRTRDL